MRNIAKLIFAGILPVIVLGLFMAFISLNLGYSLLLGLGALFIVSIYQIKNPHHLFLKIGIIAVPLLLTYYYLVVLELPGLWITLPLFLLSVVSGLLARKQALKLFFALGLCIIGSITSFLIFPDIISGNLTQKVDLPAPAFELTHVATSEKITNTNFEGKVVVLDFFGTWCAPCIAEMSELEKIKSSLAQYSNQLEFVIVCTDTGGDTLEKAQKFHSKRGLSFTLLYDTESIVHKKFKFSGVPALVIIDKNGKVRLKHEGFNQAEDLMKTLQPTIISLLNE